VSLFLTLASALISLLSGLVGAFRTSQTTALGEAAQRAADDAHTLGEVKDAQTIRHDVDALPPGDAAGELRREFNRDTRDAK
jgi:hypothetical protein